MKRQTKRNVVPNIDRFFKPFIKALELVLLLLFMFSWKSAWAIQVYPRIFTPNGDGSNDKVVFQLDNPAALPFSGEIFDITGSRVSDLVPGPKLDTLIWDGKRGSMSVPSGIYIYQIEVGNKRVTGTVIVVE